MRRRLSSLPADCAAANCFAVPEVAVVLGSGLGGFADEIRQVTTVDYADIPGFPRSTAPGHAGRFVFGYVEDAPVVVMQGRVHLFFLVVLAALPALIASAAVAADLRDGSALAAVIVVVSVTAAAVIMAVDGIRVIALSAMFHMSHKNRLF